MAAKSFKQQEVETFYKSELDRLKSGGEPTPEVVDHYRELAGLPEKHDFHGIDTTDFYNAPNVIKWIGMGLGLVIYGTVLYTATQSKFELLITDNNSNKLQITELTRDRNKHRGEVKLQEMEIRTMKTDLRRQIDKNKMLDKKIDDIEKYIIFRTNTVDQSNRR